MKKQLLILGMALLVTCGLFAQENQEFKPSGKLDGRIFANFNTQVGAEGMNPSAFELERAYFGYTYKMAPDFSARVLLDIGDGGDAGINRYAFFKNAAIFYTKDALKVGFGIQGVFSMKYQEKVWGRRYVFKSYQDYNKFSNTADLGVSAEYATDYFAFDLAMFNGEGYKVIQEESSNNYKTSIGATAKLLDEALILRAVDEYIEKDSVAQNSIALFAGYVADVFSLGFEYNMQSNFKFGDGDDRSGISAYGSYDINDKFAVFGRYDMLDASSSPGSEYSLLIAGVEYKLLKNLKAAVNIKNFDPKTSGVDSRTFAFLNLEARF